MPTAFPSGIGSPEQIDQANRAIHEQPWYLALLQSWGQDPNNVHLNDSQKQQLLQTARDKGVGISDRFEMDDSGNIQEQGHKLRNALIAAGVGAAALTGGAALGLFGGAGAAGAGAGAAGAGEAAGLGGVEAGAASGLGSLALPGAGTALGGAGAAAAGVGADSAFDAAGNFIGDSSVTGEVGAGSGIGSRILGSAGDVSKALAAASAGRASGRAAEAGINQNQDRNAIGLYAAENTANAAKNNFAINSGSLANNYANTDLAQRKFQLDAPGQRAGNAVRGDILSRAQDVTFSGLPAGITPPTINGGLRPSMFSADTRALGANMTSQARAAQAKGDTFAPLPALPTYSEGPAAPTLTSVPQSNALDTGLNVGSSALALAPTFANLLKRYTTQGA